MSNETLSEGCVKWGKSQNVDEETSTLDLTSVIFLSLTKVNYCYKDGSVIPVSFNKPLRFRGIISVKGASDIVCSKTASTANTIREKNLKKKKLSVIPFGVRRLFTANVGTPNMKCIET